MENITQAWNDITLESAEFVLEQGEKRMQATIDLAKSLSDRAVTLMQFSIPLSIALIGLILAEPQLEPLWFYLLVLAMSVVISFLSLRVYDLYSIEPIGYKPSDLLKEDDLLLEGEDQRLGLQFNVILALETRIESNEKRNRQAQHTLTYTMVLVKFLFCSSIVLLAMDLLIHKCAEG